MHPANAFSPNDDNDDHNSFKWDPRAPPQPLVPPFLPSPSPPSPHHHNPPNCDQLPRDLTEVFQGYGVRCLTAVRIGELGFTASTLVGMRDEELDHMMSTVAHLFRWDLLVGERYGIKAAVRAERRRLEAFSFLTSDDGRRRLLLHSPDHPAAALDVLSQEGLSEERVQHESGGEVGEAGKRGSGSKKSQNPSNSASKKKPKKKKAAEEEEDRDSDSGSEGSGVGYGGERQREHPFIVTESGEVARARKNGLDYLFHLYEECRGFLAQVQALAKERGDKCPTKVTNQVFRYAKKVRASYINKPKMRHYVHCYALHCLDQQASDALRREYKARGENVGAWRQACYQPLVAISARHAWDIDAVFNAHPRLSVWYVPTKLRHLCHLARSNASAAASHCSVLPSRPMF
uniref:Floricaula/leafy-like transcription factor n=1 Tax=Hyacinthus orientalis TaxID=82025 RepID=Q6QZW4_HYAOR|nr:floral meristem identity protein [Hyacinthus orientalis]